MESMSLELTLNPNILFAPRIWSDILNNFSKIPNLHIRLYVVRDLKRKFEIEASRFATQPESFPIAIMFLTDVVRSLKKVEAVTLEEIKKSRTPITHMGNPQSGTLNGWPYANGSHYNDMGNPQSGTLNGWPYANGSHYNAGSSSSANLFGTNLSYAEATVNQNKRKRDSTELGVPPTFMGMPTIPVEFPPTMSRLTSPLGLSANRVGNRTSGGLMFRSSPGVSSTVVTTSRYPAARAPTLAVARAPAPAVVRAPTPAMLDRGKQPMQASGSGSVPARREPIPRFPPYPLN
ncbi:hypothetical protein OSB04_000048 [Centaurea solstitialis]|uniref:Uncharacterized protein n=1 Tax=Centaurea solstitialis TaxID=347529 RepID=A0AA38WKA6_9ASTR|nr:hypothetical protein OSB04_000048 [Centaurea solstitialis]